MTSLELLAPARNIEIGIAAIDCGADAVYIAGPAFGARKAAGNSLEDIAKLCEYAHKFGVRVFLTVNTIVYENELDQVHELMRSAQEAGVDAFIVQDMALTRFDDIKLPLHASTQCAIRTPDKAAWLSSRGFSRLVLERELSLDQIRSIRKATDAELEFFVHGALCVCYSGQCYLSEHIAGRSANRGECVQACRSLYDLEDGDGKVLVRNKALLSLKDYQLLERLEDLAELGICSFKIEGRLKNISYVRNVVRQYSQALDKLVADHPDRYRRSSYGSVVKGFLPSPDKTFNRGYTELYIDGKRGKWSSMDAPKSMGEYIGTVAAIRKLDRQNIELTVRPASEALVLSNGDGFSIASSSGIIGFRGDVCEGVGIRCKAVPGISKGARLFRNIDNSFEREMERNPCRREIRVSLSLKISGSFTLEFRALSEDGREVLSPFNADLDTAENRDRAEALLREQLSKHSGQYNFSLDSLEVTTRGGVLPLMSASTINSIRRLLASDLDALPCVSAPSANAVPTGDLCYPEPADYRANVANSLSRGVVGDSDEAYEIAHPPGAELMRTRYCIRFELGMCPVHQGAAQSGPLFLVNNGRRLALSFDCARCEMIVSGR